MLTDFDPSYSPSTRALGQTLERLDIVYPIKSIQLLKSIRKIIHGPIKTHSKPFRTARTTQVRADAVMDHAKFVPATLLSLLVALTSTALGTTAVFAQSTVTNETSLDSPFKALTFVVGSSVTHDSNLFRRPLKTADTITNGNLGLRLDKSYAQQQLQLYVNKQFTRYDRFSYLDFDALDYNGAWIWKIGTRLSGKLSASRAESLAPFEDTTGFGRNVRISENQAFDLDAWIVDGWHLVLGISQSDQKSEQQNVLSRQPDFSSNSGSVGVKYLTRAGNSLTARQQKTDGEYINVLPGTINNDYTEDLSELSAEWKISGTSSLNGRLGWLERDNQSAARRNFSGPSSSLGYGWTPSGNISLTISAARKTEPLQDLVSGYKEDSSISLSPAWRLSDKTSAYAQVSYLKSNDKGALATSPIPPRRDTTSTAVLGLNWLAARRLTVNASVQYQQRTSNVALSEYDATIARINLSLAF